MSLKMQNVLILVTTEWPTRAIWNTVRNKSKGPI